MGISSDKKLSHFTESKVSLLCSHKPATSPYPKSEESGPHSSVVFL